MEINRGIRAKLFILFVLMGAIPFLILVFLSAQSTLEDLEEYAKQNGSFKNAIISEHITELIEKNQVALQSLALSPEIIKYLQEPTPQRHEFALKMLNDTNTIFGDSNNMALTGADAWQRIRTDGATLVNLSQRQHFKEAMKGRTYVSGSISSMATGEMIIVVEAPVRDAEGTPIGMVQRNFDLRALEEYVKHVDEEDTYIILMDKGGRIIVDTKNVSTNVAEYAIDNSYRFILDRIYNSSGSVKTEVNGEETIVSYSLNVPTGWMIVTMRPYHYIMDIVYDKAAKAIIFGVVMLFLGTLIAYWVTIRVTKPIIEMTNIVDEIASGKKDVEKLEISSNDELGQMAAAFNRLRSERDTYQQESEVDKLTGLFNKKTMENLCKAKLKHFNENNEESGFIVFYIIDLDHFKEVNDLLGHQFGDKVLIEFSKKLKKTFRPNDYTGRFGGDEFVAVVDGLPNKEVILRKAEQIRQIAFNLKVEGKGNVVTASIGISICPLNGRDYDSLFAVADKAVYHVKNHGKNGYYCEIFANEDKDKDKDDNKT